MAISYRRMMRLDQILQSRFGWDIVYILEVEGGRDGSHYTRAGEKLAKYMTDEDDVNDFFDAIFKDTKALRPEVVWAVMGIPGDMPAISRSSGRRGGRGRTLAQMFASRQRQAPAAPAPVAAAPAAPVAPTPVAAAPAAPDPVLGQVLAVLAEMQKTNAALAKRLAEIEGDLYEELPPKAEETAEEPAAEPAEVQEEPAEEPAEVAAEGVALAF